MNEITVIKDMCYDSENKLLVDMYLPNTDSPCPTFVFFHGGGFEDYRQKDMGEPLSRELAAMGVACVNPAYRHYPEAHFPDFIEDGAKAVKWVKENIAGYHHASRIFIGGHSAGAYLSMLLCFDKSYLMKQGIDSTNDIAGYVLASGQPTTHLNVLRERGIDSRAVIIDDAAPLYYVRDIGAPLLVLCTDNDIENRVEQTNLFVSTLRSFGYQSKVEYRIIEGYSHNNYLYPDEDRPETPSIGSGIISKFIKEINHERF